MVNPDEVKKEAKQIMDKFMNLMKDIEVEENFVLERKNCFREEGEGLDVDPEFKRRFLNNAPNTSGDAILSKKGDWEK